MVARPRIHDIDPESETGELLNSAQNQPIVLRRDGVQFLLSRNSESTVPQVDPEEAREALERAFGGFKNFDYRGFIAEMRLQRGQGEDEDVTE